MKIFSSHPRLGSILNGSKPKGVYIDFNPPIINRSEGFSDAAGVIITLKFAADLDVKTVAAWILSYAPKGIKKIETYKNTEISIEIGAIKACIKQEKSEKKEYK